MPIYVGASIETGNTWMKANDVDLSDLRLHASLYLGIDSPIGPVYIAAGWGDDNERAYYFFLGRTF